MGPCGASQRLIAQGSAPKLGDLGLGRYVRGRLCISPDVNFTVFKAMIDVSPLTRMIDKKRATRSNHDSSRVPRRRLAFRRARGGFGFAAAALVSAKTSRGRSERLAPPHTATSIRSNVCTSLEGVHSHPPRVRTPSHAPSALAKLRSSARDRILRARLFAPKVVSRWLPRASWTRSRTRKSR